MDFNKQTFCTAPWFQIKTGQFGNYQSCSAIDHSRTEFVGRTEYQWPADSPEEWLDSEYSRYLRQNLTQGIRIAECHRCWKYEDHGHRSMRQVLNDTVTLNLGHDLDQSWVKPYLNKKQDYAHDLIVNADVKLTNVCNFSCSMCNPADSSQIYSIWSRDRTHPMVQELTQHRPSFLMQVRENYKNRTNYDLLRQVLEKTPRHLKLLGGEPLLDREAIEILAAVEPNRAQNMRLVFLTNGSQDMVEVAQKLSHYHTVAYVVSLDGVGAVQDYIRRGSDWTVVSNNIDAWLAYRPHKSLKIHITVQALNLAHIPELLDWVRPRGLDVSFGVVEDPKFLGLRSIPSELKMHIQQILSAASGDSAPATGCQAQFSHNFIDRVNSTLASLLENVEYCQLDNQKMSEFLQWYDPHRRWETLFPEWIGYL